VVATGLDDGVVDENKEYRVEITVDKTNDPDYADKTMSVSAINNSVNLPRAVKDETTTMVNQDIVIDALANDSDAEGAITLVEVIAFYGTVEIVSNKIHYTPTTNFVGADTLTYTIKDSDNHTKQSTVNIIVSPLVQSSFPRGMSLISPIGETISETPPFVWDPATEPIEYYELILEPAVGTTPLTTTSTMFKPNITLPTGNYTWTVRYRTPAGSDSLPVEPQANFTVKAAGSPYIYLPIIQKSMAQ
jgi:hypothetical protein